MRLQLRSSHFDLRLYRHAGRDQMLGIWLLVEYDLDGQALNDLHIIAGRDRIRRATRFRASDRARHVCRAGGQSAMSAVADALMPGSIPAARRPAVNPWIIAVTVTLATFMELLDTSIANVSLPHIAGGLSTGQDESTW